MSRPSSRRGWVRETVAAIEGTAGVAVAAPALEHQTYLLTGPSAGLPAAVTIVGIDPVREPLVHDLTLVDGFGLTGTDEPSALITQRLATEDGLAVGSELTVQGAGTTANYRVIGILAGDGPLVGTFGRTVVVPLRTAQAVFDEAGVSRVDLGLSDGTDPATVAAALEKQLLFEPYVLSSPADLAASLRSSTADFQATTALIAAIALFAGAFLIFNTLSMTLVERARDVGLLRAARRHSRSDHRLRVAPGVPARRRGFRAGCAPGLSAGGRDGGLCPDRGGRHAGRAESPALRLRRGDARGRRRDSGSSRRTGPAGRPDLADRGAQSSLRGDPCTACPPGLAGPGLRGGSRRGTPCVAAWHR